MGFSPNRIEAALRNASSQNLEDCIQWLEENESKFEAAEKLHKELSGDDGASGSIEIDGDNTDGETVQEAPKELTAEEKEAKLEILRQKAAVRKAEQAKKDAEEQKKNEMIRRKHDQESARIKEELKKKEAMLAAARRKQEAKEDALAKKRIKDLIEADRRERMEKKQQLAAGNTTDGSSASITPPPPVTTTSQPRPKPNYSESKLRFRVQGIPSPSPTIMKTFPIDTTLGEVAESLSVDLSIAADSIIFTTTFPTRTLTSSDFSLSLKQADLVNANVIVKKA